MPLSTDLLQLQSCWVSHSRPNRPNSTYSLRISFNLDPWLKFMLIPRKAWTTSAILKSLCSWPSTQLTYFCYRCSCITWAIHEFWRCSLISPWWTHLRRGFPLFRALPSHPHLISLSLISCKFRWRNIESGTPCPWHCWLKTIYGQMILELCLVIPTHRLFQPWNESYHSPSVHRRRSFHCIQAIHFKQDYMQFWSKQVIVVNPLQKHYRMQMTLYC